jgi:hypothetical protein
MTTDYPFIHECIRMYTVDISTIKGLQEILREELKEHYTLTKNQKVRLMSIPMNNKQVFSAKLIKCNSYSHYMGCKIEGICLLPILCKDKCGVTR